ncbi:MAG: transketolase, partial [Actinomycetota bacterium]|nr:transketolase [Actinomycetota bacterium]
MSTLRSLTPEQDQLAISVIRGIAMDGPLAANSGHQGTAMALAPLAHVLYSRVMRYNPADPDWVDRDRFILSAGHASILQYAMLHLSGTSLSADDLRAFRQWGSATPGHPEAGHTPGVEVTTGPLGQGFANAVGMAISERLLREQFGADAISHHTWVI